VFLLAAAYFDPNMMTLGAESYVVHIADGSRLQLVADRSEYATQTAQIAAYERHVNGLRGVFIVSVLSVVFLAGFAFLPSQEEIK